MEKKDLRSLTIEEMTELAESMGQKTFRGKQLFEWIHKKQVENLEEISNLPKAFLEPLQENYMVSGVALVAAEARHNVLRFSLLDQAAIVRVGYKGPGHGQEVRFAGGNGRFAILRIKEPGGGGNGLLDALALDIFRHV